ncbi:MAG: hypothetical protein V8Q82_07440 [Christensenellales bacterium]
MKDLLDGRMANGIIFTTMFKFERGEKPLSERRNMWSWRTRPTAGNMALMRES